MQTEKDVWFFEGILGICIEILLIGLFILNIAHQEMVFAAIFLLLFFIILTGFTTNGDYEATRIKLFGKYVGTLRKQGLAVTIPFTKKERVSLQRYPLQFTLNDFENVHVKITLFFRVVDTAKAVFTKEYVEKMIRIYSETILQLLVQNDHLHEVDGEEKNNLFVNHMNEKVKEIGIEVTEAHLFVINKFH